METFPKIYLTVAVFIGANLIVCINTAANSSANLQTTEAKPVDSLPQDFSPELREILSPEIFTKADPLNYILQKTLKLDYKAKRNVNKDLCSGFVPCINARFPALYVPYAKLLRWLLYFITELDSVNIFIRSDKRSRDSASYRPPPDFSTLDPEFSSLFSPDIFSDPNSPSVLIGKLIALPETRFSSIAAELQHSEHPVVKYYFWYSRSLVLFLRKDYNVNALKNLQQVVVEIQHIKLPVPAIDSSEQKQQVSS